VDEDSLKVTLPQCEQWRSTSEDKSGSRDASWWHNGRNAPNTEAEEDSWLNMETPLA